MEDARISVLMKPTDSFPITVKLKLSNGEILEIRVKYEWKPTICPHCNFFGHEATQYSRKPVEPVKKKGNTKKTWVPITKEVINISDGVIDNAEKVTDVSEFASPSTILANNLFSPLSESDADMEADLSDDIPLGLEGWNIVCRDKGKKKSYQVVHSPFAKKNSSRAHKVEIPSMRFVADSSPATRK